MPPAATRRRQGSSGNAGVGGTAEGSLLSLYHRPATETETASCVSASGPATSSVQRFSDNPLRELQRLYATGNPRRSQA